jgi:transketolase
MGKAGPVTPGTGPILTRGGSRLQKPKEDIEELKKIAYEVRRHVLKMTTAAGSGHPGGSMSATDVLVCLYFNVMKHDPGKPDWPDRDRFVLSKGHAAPSLYAVLAECGYFSKKLLPSLRKLGSPLQGHPDMKRLPGIEMSTGSLGQGISTALGMAMGCRLDGRKNHVFCMIGDGESQEGQVWEAAMAAAHNRLDNLTVILDENKLQIDGSTDEIMNVSNQRARWKAFGWDTHVIDGHNYKAILKELHRKKEEGKPRMIVAQTVKGKGVDFMENQLKYHGAPLSKDELKKALEALQVVG